MSKQLAFNPARFYRLLRANVLENYKTMAMMLGGIFLALVFVMYLIQLSDNMESWNNRHYMTYFVITFLITGLLYNGHAFSAFRNKEKTIHYLTLPASAGEKFAVELVTRLLSFLILYPIIFWLAVTFESLLMEKLYSFKGYVHLPFNYLIGYDQTFNTPDENIFTIMMTMVFIGFQIIAFAGSGSFLRFPLVKSILIFGILLGFFISLIWFLMEIVELRNYRKETVLFINSEEELTQAIVIGLAIAMTGLLSATYFKLKEKEV